MKKGILRLGIILLLVALCVMQFSACKKETPTPDQPGDGQTGGETGGGTGGNTDAEIPPETPASKLFFTLNNGDGMSYTVMGLKDRALTTLVLPTTYRGLPVTGIGYGAFRDCTELTSVTIGDSVTSIGDFAFSGCTGLTSVAIGNCVTGIGWCAFSGCTGLTSITIPDSVTSIGPFAFLDCKSLTSITFKGTIAQWNAISFGYAAITGSWIHCTDGDISLIH